MNPRQRMRESNRLARLWLLKEGYNDIWFKMHSRRHDRVYTQKDTYMALDLWNLFDGACFSKEGRICFFQVKTNRFAPEEPLYDFIRNRHGFDILNINVKQNGGTWRVLVRLISGS